MTHVMPEDAFSRDQLDTLMIFCRRQNSAFMPDRWLSYINGECGPNGGAVKEDAMEQARRLR